MGYEEGFELFMIGMGIIGVVVIPIGIVLVLSACHAVIRWLCR